MQNLNWWTHRHHSSYGKIIVKISYKNSREKYIKLSDSQMKNFKLYHNTERDFRYADELDLTKSQLKLEELWNVPTNYYKDISYTLTYDQIKKIFENKDNQLSIVDLVNYIESNYYLYILNNLIIELSTGIINKIKN